ncbi:MAG TPA: sulfotransferase [Stellaceae bacterium]|nr:sulfotransferase [Stellaceae bacterium]
MSDFPLGWAPIRIYPRDDGLWVDWCYLGEERFREPFFDATIDICLRSPFNQLFRPRTPIARLCALPPGAGAVPPTGFIFHMSRCGSTLVSQMLARLSQNIVISEASPIDAVVRSNEARPEVSDEQRVLWLRGLMSHLGQRRSGERNFFVKFDCWHVLELPLLRRAFPAVPWIFLYRDPVEVLVSQMKMRGAQMVPGIVTPALFKIDPVAAVQMPAVEYCARVLAAICDAALQNFSGGGGLLVNYRDLPQALTAAILPHFGVESAGADLAAMADAAAFDAKTPSLPFAPDAAAKIRAADDAVRAAAETWIAPLYAELEALRARSTTDAAMAKV